MTKMELHLNEEQWPTILESTIEGLKLRAKVRGVQLQTTIAPDLPTVAVDRLSIQEVITNLVDNAVKYSAGAKLVEINVHMNQEGQVETTFTDHGQGISAGIMPNLFTKFYRDHRNRAQIGGTGLGLYLCKTIVEAHGGHIWVKSKEKEGSTFGFTLLPYASLAAELKNGDNTDIVRGARLDKTTQCIGDNFYGTRSIYYPRRRSSRSPRTVHRRRTFYCGAL